MTMESTIISKHIYEILLHNFEVHTFSFWHFAGLANSCKEEALNKLPQCHSTVMSRRKPDLANHMARFICRNFAVLGFGKYCSDYAKQLYCVMYSTDLLKVKCPTHVKSKCNACSTCYLQCTCPLTSPYMPVCSSEAMELTRTEH